MAKADMSLTLGAHGAAVKDLHASLAKAGIAVPAAESDAAQFGTATRDAVLQFQDRNKLPTTGELDPVSGAILTGTAAAASRGQWTVSGSIAMDYGAPAAEIGLLLYTIGFGGSATVLTKGKTDTNGAFTLAYAVQAAPPNLELRALDPAGKEVALSRTMFSATSAVAMNLVAPAAVLPLAPEYSRIAKDLAQHAGGVERLAGAQEASERRDITLVSRASQWDARLVSLLALAAKESRSTGLGTEILYALYRTGLPTDPQQLALFSADTVAAALDRANKAGIVDISAEQIMGAEAAFTTFASRSRLAMAAPGTGSSYQELIAGVIADPQQQTAFAELFFSGDDASGIWDQAARQMPKNAISALRLQGKLLYLTSNNAALSQSLQNEFGSVDRLPDLAAAGLYDAGGWRTLLEKLAGGQDDKALDALIPPAYDQTSAADRLSAYAGDLARLVRLSFPTEVTAALIDARALQPGQADPASLATFLRAAAPLGFQLGRTPLSRFLAAEGEKLPALDTDGTAGLKAVHRAFQLSPSNESMQVLMAQGLTSAQQIVALKKDAFIDKYGTLFPSSGEAELVYGKAQQIASVTFNFLAMAKQLDNAPPVYGLSGGAAAQQAARNAIVEHFPTMASLFGNVDFCQCADCRSVLSPAAYFVDLLEYLRKSGANAAGYTPLDVLIGKDATVPGRRPDLAALPLSCENTNTAMPYIDLVNDIFEYYIAHNGLDANAAHDTGNASTDDLVAEPQYILPAVYTDTLAKAVYPLTLPFDLWIETVRGFLSYYKTPLARVLEVLRPVDALELFDDGAARPYYRAQVFAETLGLSPDEYAILTVTDLASGTPSVIDWFKLYGYPDEGTALNGTPDPTDAAKFLVEPLRSARNLSQRLGISYQNVVDLVETGFLNPALDRLTFQFDRFGISLGDAFSYTGQPGRAAMSATDQAVFDAKLDAINQRYQAANPGFDAKAWLVAAVPANVATTIWVLDDPDSGCDFTHTALQYADGSALTAFDFLRINLFVRLWRKTGWTIEEVDRALQAFFPAAALPAWGDPAFPAAYGAAWKTALVNLSHLETIFERLKPAMGRLALLPLWGSLSVQGTDPLYARLFLTPDVLNADPAFDDPAGAFPSDSGNSLSAHLPALLGTLGLAADAAAAILTDAGAATVTLVVDGQNVTAPAFTLANISILYRYAMLARCLDMPVASLIALKGLSGLDPMRAPGGNAYAVLDDDVLFTRTIAFLDQAAAVKASGFDIAALQYLLRHQFDPAGPYQQDPNAAMTLVQSIAVGLRQIASQNALPANLAAAGDDVLQQKLATLLPAPVLQGFATLVGNGQSYSASQGGVVPASQIDPVPFAAEDAVALAYDATTQTQTLTFRGPLLDWKKAQLLQIDGSALFSALLDGVQAQAEAAFTTAMEDLLGMMASLVEYEAAETGVAVAVAGAPLVAADPGIRVSYDQVDQLQWLGYRGVLTEEKRAVLIAIDASPALAALLTDVQGQAMPAWRRFMGSMLAIIAQGQGYVATANAVPPANAIDARPFAAWPQARFRYDPATQTQSISFQGILTDGDRLAMSALLPASAVLPPLLQDVADQAQALFVGRAAHLLTVVPGDLAGFAKNVAGLSGASLQRRAKAALLEAFQPLMTRKLSQALVVGSVSAALSADPAFTADLLTEASLLNDPNAPGKSLLATYLACGTQGASARFWASPDQSGALLANGVAAAVDLTDPANPNAGGAGTGSARFEGYLQVPTDGPYRFFAELGDINARAVLQLVPPDPAVLLPTPILDATAAHDRDEASQFVQLQGGVPYRFTLNLTALGATGASLLVQGETVPKGALGQLVLMPGDVVAALLRNQTLLAKAMQIVGTLALNEREFAYLAANGERFGRLRLSALPTQVSDDSPAGAAALFQQFLALADYAALRKGPLGGSDGLISVFANVGVTYTEATGSGAANAGPDTPWTRLANLTRRDPQTVRDIAIAFGLVQQVAAGGDYQVTALPALASGRGIRRLWDALQLVQLVGVPALSLIAATAIVSPAPPAGSPAPDSIAATLKNAVQARYTAEGWRPVAKSVFDMLRRRKRDALIAWLLRALGLDSAEQLFEYFLVDPGMEPVVQTSRIRLALSSVQTFVQRCLLNLESGTGAARSISPSALDADWWGWMKRYRVWEANREIFLYPENWMEPELRLDKTDLFQQLESALTQGDITRDLAESAFLDYLKGLDVRARLDVVATYLDQDLTTPGLSTLHVLARTYGKPHKYFYRTYAQATWSAWVAVKPDIEGDHIAIAMWRGKLNLFWLTFSKKQKPMPAPTGNDTGAITSLTFNGLAKKVYTAAPQEQLLVQLSWCEYFQGSWSDRVSTDMNKVDPIDVDTDFDVRCIHLHVSKEANEAAIRIHLDFPDKYRIIMVPVMTFALQKYGVSPGAIATFLQSPNRAFRITSRNCDPAFTSVLWQAPPPNPYNASTPDATVFTGSGTLKASFQSHFTTSGSQTESETILQTVQDFGIVTTANAIAPPFLPPNDPNYAEAGALVSPFFFKDQTHPSTPSEATFFVQPSLTEVTLQRWVGWALPPVLKPPVWVGLVPIVAQLPKIPIPINTGDPEWSVHPVISQIDWVTNPATAITYGGTPIGAQGGLDLEVNAALVAAAAAQSPEAAGFVTQAIAAARNSHVMMEGGALSAAQLDRLDAAQAAVVADAAAMAGTLALRQAGEKA